MREPKEPPKDRIIEMWNPMSGWNATKWDSDMQAFPLYNWDGLSGVWFPVARKWREYNSLDNSPQTEYLVMKIEIKEFVKENN